MAEASLGAVFHTVLVVFKVTDFSVHPFCIPSHCRRENPRLPDNFFDVVFEKQVLPQFEFRAPASLYCQKVIQRFQ